MKQILPCKLCLKNFEYSPGPAGNARQICELCKSQVDENELQRLEDETIIEKNRYLIGAPKRKDEYDPLNILMDGNIPEFNSDPDRFICTMEMSTFIKRTNSITGLEENLSNFLDQIGFTYRMLFLKQMRLSILETMIQDSRFKSILKEIMVIVV